MDQHPRRAGRSSTRAAPNPPSRLRIGVESASDSRSGSCPGGREAQHQRQERRRDQQAADRSAASATAPWPVPRSSSGSGERVSWSSAAILEIALIEPIEREQGRQCATMTRRARTAGKMPRAAPAAPARQWRRGRAPPPPGRNSTTTSASTPWRKPSRRVAAHHGEESRHHVPSPASIRLLQIRAQRQHGFMAGEDDDTAGLGRGILGDQRAEERDVRRCRAPRSARRAARASPAPTAAAPGPARRRCPAEQAAGPPAHRASRARPTRCQRPAPRTALRSSSQYSAPEAEILRRPSDRWLQRIEDGRECASVPRDAPRDRRRSMRPFQRDRAVDSDVNSPADQGGAAGSTCRCHWVTGELERRAGRDWATVEILEHQ